MIFKYSGYDSSGKRVKSRIEANDIDEAKLKLKARGILYDTLHESSESIFKNLKFRKKPELANKKLANLSRNLAIYLKSSIPIVNVIKLMKSQYEHDNIMLDFLNSLENSMDEGHSFYDALENQTIVQIPSFYKQSIKVAQESGALSEVLFEMARFIDEQSQVSAKVKQALIYPMIIVIVSIFLVAMMLSVVVPKITQMFAQMKQELPQITKFVIATGDFLGEYWIVIVVAIIIFSAIFSYFLKTSYKFRYIFDLILLKLPFFGPVIKTFELARFSYITSVLSNSGVTFVHAVKLASSILDNKVIQKEFEEASKDVVEGKKLSNSLLKHGSNIDKSFIQAIALGEETSEVALVMENLANLYFEENKDKIAMFLAVLEPMLILVVGGIIAVIVIAMLLPIFSMNLAGV